MENQPFPNFCRSGAFALAAVLGTVSGVVAQAVKDIRTPDARLVPKAHGSFFVGGDRSNDTGVS